MYEMVSNPSIDIILCVLIDSSCRSGRKGRKGLSRGVVGDCARVASSRCMLLSSRKYRLVRTGSVTTKNRDQGPTSSQCTPSY